MHFVKQPTLCKLLGVILLLSSCAGLRPKAIAPTPPVMKPVTVVGGTISGTSLDATIDNHISLWKYIKELYKLGGFKCKGSKEC